MGFSRQEYWSELPFPSPGDLPDPGIKRRSPSLQADALTSEPPGKPNPDGRAGSLCRLFGSTEPKNTNPDPVLGLGLVFLKNWPLLKAYQPIKALSCAFLWEIRQGPPSKGTQPRASTAQPPPARLPVQQHSPAGTLSLPGDGRARGHRPHVLKLHGVPLPVPQNRIWRNH